MKSLKMIILSGGIVMVIAFVALFFEDISFFAKESRQGFMNFWTNSCSEDSQKIALQNKLLEYELEQLKKNDSCKKDSVLFFEKEGARYSAKKAKVFSEYPFNDRGIILLNIGSGDGIKEGMPVVTKENMLVGIIKKTNRTQSEVQTIFDPLWKSSVAIGANEVKAVLEGGSFPKLTLIPKGSELQDEMKVINISPDYPFHVFLGSVKNVINNESDVWISAELDSLYEIGEINEVQVITNFP
jgi:cell shape-determining protein MreC